MARDLLGSGWRAFRVGYWWAELWSAITAVIWSTVTCLSVQKLVECPSMRVLAEIGDDRFWHVLGFGLGLGQAVMLGCDRRWGRWARGMFAVAQGWFWGVLALGMWVATSWSLAVAVYAGWCLLNVASIMRLRLPLLARAGG